MFVFGPAFNIRRLVILGFKFNFRCFIRDYVTSIIFTEVTIKLYCVEVVDLTCNIQYLKVNSLLHITFFISLKMSGFEPYAMLFGFNFEKS